MQSKKVQYRRREIFNYLLTAANTSAIMNIKDIAINNTFY